VGSGLFLVIQMVILLDFTAAWNASWVQRESESWLYALLAVTLTCIGAALTLVGLLFHWYAVSSMLPNASQCSPMLPNAPQCSLMLPNAPQCSPMLPNAP
jgi:hypothetical protein